MQWEIDGPEVSPIYGLQEPGDACRRRPTPGTQLGMRRALGHAAGGGGPVYRRPTAGTLLCMRLALGHTTGSGGTLSAVPRLCPR